MFYFSTPQQFTKLFLEADYVIVSSFHGTALAINLQKQFVTFAPDKFASRTDDLLKVFGLGSRLVYSYDLSHSSLQPIDYARVNELLVQEREKSLRYIDSLCKHR